MIINVSRCLSTVFLFTIGFAVAANSTPFECQIESKSGENFDYAVTQLWIPDDDKNIRGILCVVLHPLDKNGSLLAHPEPWIRLASESNCALISVSFAQSDDSTRNWCLANQGTGRALFAAVDELARKCKNSALSKVPITIIGVCAAGQFAYHLTAWKPERMAAFVTIGGGKHDLTKAAFAAKTPGLLVIANDRGRDAIHNLEVLDEEGRKRSAPWACITETVGEYDAGMCSGTVIGYLRSVLNGKLPANSRQSAEPKYIPISICSRRLPLIASVTPSSIDIGTVDALREEGIPLSFTIQKFSGSETDTVFLPTSDVISGCQIRPSSEGMWQVSCRLNINAFPSGPLHAEIPVRFRERNKEILGGEKMTITGRILGKIDTMPRSLNLGNIKAGTTMIREIVLSSRTGTPCELPDDAVASDIWIKLNAEKKDNGTVILACHFAPPQQAQFKSFSGYVLVSYAKPYKYTFKVFYYGVLSAQP